MKAAVYAIGFACCRYNAITGEWSQDQVHLKMASKVPPPSLEPVSETRPPAPPPSFMPRFVFHSPSGEEP